MTNFSAVCVGEKPTTFTSTSPAALPAAIVARSEISGRPFGRMIHKAPFGLSEALSFSSRVSSASFVTPKKIASHVLDDAADRQVGDGLLELAQERSIVDADSRHAPSGLTPIFWSRDGGC